jgi:hypothetical protein
MEALSSSETSVLIRATRRNIPEDTTLHSHRRENLKSYTEEPGFSDQAGATEEECHLLGCYDRVALAKTDVSEER